MSRTLRLLAVGLLVGAGCGTEDSVNTGESVDPVESSTSAAPVSEPEPVESPLPAETPPPADQTTTTEPVAEFDISMVQPSVVKIFAEGTFVDPEVGLQVNSAGVGTGFIISDDGLAVTNNHVVTGAALLRVYVPDRDQPVNAQVLAVSECSDLAVIKLVGDGYPALEFRDAESKVGLPVYSAGYPVTDATTIEEVDYTLTQGIVSSLTSSGETYWASVDSVMEHDARIRGGNSGGPVMDDDGRVVAINYASLDVADQNFAIAGPEAQPILDRLIVGESVDSIGINGQAVLTDEISGIWVASVESGSPADQAGIEPGDIITRLEGLVLSTDGTMNDYCDVIRTQGAEATMDIEVLRYATEEVLEGQLNGDPLTLSFSFAQEYQDDVVSGDSGTYDSYTTVTDDTGQAIVDVPTEWSDIDGTFNEDFGPSLYAAPSLPGFLESWETPGLILEVSNELTAADIDTVLDELDQSGPCVYEGREPYEDPLYSGLLDLWTDCGGVGTVVFTVAVSPADGAFVARMFIQVVETRDLDAADQVFSTFYVG